MSLKTAMKVLRDKKPERLHETLTEEVRGERTRKVLDEKKVMKLKASTKKAWSIRSLRWMAQMPEELVVKDISLQSTKKELKKWIRGSVPVKGDRILWGQRLTGEMERKRRHGESGPQRDNDKDGNENSSGEIQEEDEDIDVGDAAEEREGPQDIIEDHVNTVMVKIRTRMKKKRRNCGNQRKKRRPGRREGTGLGGRVPVDLPRAGVEPPNPGKRGSLSPQVFKGHTTGQMIMLWCTLSLTLMYFMSLRQNEENGRRRCKQQKKQHSEEQGQKISRRTQRKKKVQPRCGIG